MNQTLTLGIHKKTTSMLHVEEDNRAGHTSGFCIKTNSAEGKVFINICHSPSIPPPADLTEDELLQMLEEDQAGFRIPMSLGEPHAEMDAKGQGCTAYDVAVNSDFFRRMQNSDFLRELVITIAREGLEDKYGLQLNPGEGVGPVPPGGA
nr:PIH1 domain-containing protein 1-like [Odocoileus virginianus texanus]